MHAVMCIRETAMSDMLFAQSLFFFLQPLVDKNPSVVVGHVRNDQSSGAVVDVAPIHAPLMRAKAKRGIYEREESERMKLKAGDGVCLFKAIGAATECALAMVCMGHSANASPSLCYRTRECNETVVNKSGPHVMFLHVSHIDHTACTYVASECVLETGFWRGNALMSAKPEPGFTYPKDSIRSKRPENRTHGTMGTNANEAICSGSRHG